MCSEIHVSKQAAHFINTVWNKNSFQILYSIFVIETKYYIVVVSNLATIKFCLINLFKNSYIHVCRNFYQKEGLVCII